MKEILEIFARERCSAILRTSHASAVQPALQAAVDGGFEIIECTLSTPGAFDAIRAFAAKGDLVVGAGTVLTTEEAAASVDAGAKFIVSPVMDPAVITWCVERDIVVVPGTSTPTEMLAAHRAGAPIVKYFPGPPDGPTTVKTILGPMPFLKIFPTSGVTLENARAYLDAGAFGLGFVNCLFDPTDIANERFDAIRDHASEMVAAAKRP